MLHIKEEILKELREKYPEGSRVRLVKMDDVQAPPLGSYGTVKHVDDTGTIHVSWDKGGSLGVVYGEDLCVKIQKFNSGREMYEFLCSGKDLYSKNKMSYIFEYNDAHALCHYCLDSEAVCEILRKKDANEYWGAYLGIGGGIMDASDYDNEDYRYSENPWKRMLYLRPSIEYCMEMYKVNDWVDTEDVTEEYVQLEVADAVLESETFENAENEDASVPTNDDEWDVATFIDFESETSIIYPFATNFEDVTMEQIREIVKKCNSSTDNTETLYAACNAVLGVNHKLREKSVYTADDEEPKCGRCDYFAGGFDCDNLCGAKHGWNGYTRTE